MHRMLHTFLKSSFLFASIIILSFYSTASHAQITNSGKDFWFGFAEVYDSSSASFVVYISSLVNSSGTLTIPGQSVTKSFTVTAGTITKVSVTVATVEVTTSEVLENKAIHITSNNDIV